MNLNFVLIQLKKDLKSLSWAIIVLIAYFSLLQLLFHSLCPLQILVGYPCPGCGMTRACLLLLQLKFKEAWMMHPGAYLFVILVILGFYERYIAQRKHEKITKVILVFTCSFLVIFYLWRMYEYFPNVAPMTYFKHNIYHLLIGKII